VFKAPALRQVDITAADAGVGQTGEGVEGGKAAQGGSSVGHSVSVRVGEEEGQDSTGGNTEYGKEGGGEDGVGGGGSVSHSEAPGDCITFHNYLGVGVDAAAALRFHRARDTNPELFVSAVTNKLLYGVFGAMDILDPSCADLRRHVHVFADGVEVELPPQTQGVILLNINSYLGGVRMWDEGEVSP